MSESSLTQIHANWITNENFQPYGQLITPAKDGKSYDVDDAQLDLQQGTPRFYIMRLHEKGLSLIHI